MTGIVPQRAVNRADQSSHAALDALADRDPDALVTLGPSESDAAAVLMAFPVIAKPVDADFRRHWVVAALSMRDFSVRTAGGSRVNVEFARDASCLSML